MSKHSLLIPNVGLCNFLLVQPNIHKPVSHAIDNIAVSNSISANPRDPTPKTEKLLNKFISRLLD